MSDQPTPASPTTEELNRRSQAMDEGAYGIVERQQAQQMQNLRSDSDGLQNKIQGLEQVDGIEFNRALADQAAERALPFDLNRANRKLYQRIGKLVQKQVEVDERHKTLAVDEASRIHPGAFKDDLDKAA